MSTYYIDLLGGRESNDGLSPEMARNNYKDLVLPPGDKALFRRGTFIRGMLETRPYVSYGTYGEGDVPTFCGSSDASNTSDWQQTEHKNIWKCTKNFPR